MRRETHDLLPRGSSVLVQACAALALAGFVLASCGRPVSLRAPDVAPVPAHRIIPAPVSIELDDTSRFAITRATGIFVPPGQDEGARIGRYLAGLIGTAAGPSPPVVAEAGESIPPGGIYLALGTLGPTTGEEGYELTVTPERATLVANAPAGLFYGVQTIRQLLPPAIEYRAALARPIDMPAVRIRDAPRFPWRGAMLDVSRHFLRVEDVKRYIDLMALHKLNRLHLHLSDDQGWRIEIRSWPNLALYGGSTEVGGGPGGYYTQAEYAGLVAYAASRFITIVPEIDMPGHTNAALASYPELNCDDVAPPLYTGIKVGFSALCVEKEITYRFVDDVVREIASLTPGPYFHVGGDEVEKLTDEQYVQFIERVQAIVQSHGKQMIGWGEIAPANLLPTSIVQHWRPKASPREAVERGSKVILSPAHRIYLDMKYDQETVLGLNWAGHVDVRTAYGWEPATLLEGVPEEAILGVEAPLWSETLVNIRDFEYLAFPRLAGVAEIGWSPAGRRDWDEYRVRLGAQAPRWSALGINFYRSPDVPWQ
jgi:hexosaminidase